MRSLNSLPRGIIQARSDLELKPLWSTTSSKSKAKVLLSILLNSEKTELPSLDADILLVITLFLDHN